MNQLSVIKAEFTAKTKKRISLHTDEMNNWEKEITEDLPFPAHSLFKLFKSTDNEFSGQWIIAETQGMVGNGRLFEEYIQTLVQNFIKLKKPDEIDDVITVIVNVEPATESSIQKSLGNTHSLSQQAAPSVLFQTLLAILAGLLIFALSGALAYTVNQSQTVARLSVSKMAESSNCLCKMNAPQDKPKKGSDKKEKAKPKNVSELLVDIGKDTKNCAESFKAFKKSADKLKEMLVDSKACGEAAENTPDKKTTEKNSKK